MRKEKRNTGQFYMMEELLEELLVLKYFCNNESYIPLLKKIWQTLEKSAEREIKRTHDPPPQSNCSNI